MLENSSLIVSVFVDCADSGLLRFMFCAIRCIIWECVVCMWVCVGVLQIRSATCFAVLQPDGN